MFSNFIIQLCPEGDILNVGATLESVCKKGMWVKSAWLKLARLTHPGQISWPGPIV